MAYVVEYDVDAVLDMLDRLPDELQDKVMRMAINKTADKAKAEMRRQILSHYNIKSAVVSGSLYVSPARASHNVISASLWPSSEDGAYYYKGRSMNVIHFVQGYSSGDLLFQFLKNGGLKTIGPGSRGESKPFIGNLGRTVFRRTGEPKTVASKGRYKGKLREPIEPVQVVGLPQMFNTKSINEAVLEKASEDLLEEVDRAVNFMLS